LKISQRGTRAGDRWGNDQAVIIQQAVQGDAHLAPQDELEAPQRGRNTRLPGNETAVGSHHGHLGVRFGFQRQERQRQQQVPGNQPERHAQARGHRHRRAAVEGIGQHHPWIGWKPSGTVEGARAAMEVLRLGLGDFQKLVRNADGQVAPLSASAKDTLAAARSTLAQAQKSLVTLTEAATPALKQAEKALAGTSALTSPNSVLITDLERTLRALEETARSIRALTDMLQRNPEVLLRGKSR
jgi:hypothetical protein